MTEEAQEGELQELLRAPPELEHRTVIPVLGLPVSFESNTARVLAAVEESFGFWRVLEKRPEWVEPKGAVVRVVVRRGREGPGHHAAIRHRLAGKGRLRLSTLGSQAFADFVRGAAAACITPPLLADVNHFRYGVLEALTFFLLSSHNRQPVHAAALERNGSALLLAGASGVGKSTVAYAGLTAGMKVLSEDVVYLQSRPALRVWGNPGFLHLPVDSRRHFPELNTKPPMLRANGKLKIAVDLRAAGGVPTRPFVETVGTCLLRRGGATPTLERLGPEDLEAALIRNLEPGFDRFATSVGPVIRRAVQQNGGWRLSLNDRPQEALPLLFRLFDALEG